MTSSGLTLNSGNSIYVLGGVANGTVVGNGASVLVFANGVANGSVLLSGGSQSVAAGVANGTIVSSGGRQYVANGGTARNTIVNSGGFEYVSSGGAASGTVVSSGGTQYVYPGGIAQGTVVQNGGSTTTIVGAGQVASGLVVASGNDLYVLAGGTVVDAVISSGGVAHVQSGGLASGTLVHGGGTEIVLSGEVVRGSVVSDGGFENVSAGGMASGTLVGSGGVAYVRSGGVATATVLRDGGTEYVEAGGIASGTVVSSRGSQNVDSAGLTVGTVVSGGGQETVFTGGVSSATVVLGQGRENIYAGGVANGSVISSGGAAIVYGGGTASGSVLSAGGHEVVSSGGVASATTVGSGGTLHPSAGATTVGTVVLAGGTIAPPPPNSVAALLIGSSWAAAPGTPVTITYSFMTQAPSYASAQDANGFAPLNAANQQKAQAALALWSQVAGITFVQVSDAGDGGQIRFGSNDQGTLGYAYFPGDSAGGDVYVDNTPANDGLLPVYIHELGHALGLKHPYEGTPVLPPATSNNDYTVMSDTSGTARPVTPMLYDIQAIQYLYGANTTAHAGDDHYVFVNDSFTDDAVGQCIWDPGGINTFDFSACTGQTVIDLRQGGFSSLFHGMNNISIAFGTVIQNAIAGNGGDIIYCNDAGDTIAGGLGDDTIFAGAGDDHISGGGGTDTVVLAGARASYAISYGSGSVAVTGPGGSDTLEGIETLIFADATISVPGTTTAFPQFDDATGSGHIFIQSGTTISTGAGSALAPLGLGLGGAAGSTGDASVVGTGALLANIGPFLVGDAGMGSLSIQSGGRVTTTHGTAQGGVQGTVQGAAQGIAGLLVANTAGADGSSVSVTGMGSDLRVDGTIGIGVGGSGSLRLNDGASVTADTLSVGLLATGVGQISVTGSGSSLTVLGDATVADDGTGVLSVLSGGTFAAATLTIGSQANSSGALVVSGAGSRIDLSGALNVGTALGIGDLTVGPGAEVHAAVVNLQGQVVLEGGLLDPTVTIINQGQTAGGNGTIQAGDIIVEGVIQAGGARPSQRLLVIDGTVLGGGTLSINGTAHAPNAAGVLQINAGGTLELKGAVLNAPATTFADNLAQPNAYAIDNSVIDIEFADATGVLVLDDIAGFAGTIAAYQSGDAIVVTGGTLSSLGVSNGNTLTFLDTGPNAGSGGIGRIIFDSPVSAESFAIVNGNTIGCFAAGTRIETATGLVAVEALSVGASLVTVDGALEPVVWIGRRKVDCRDHPRPAAMWPIRVKADTFGPRMPGRDLWLSPDHAVFVNGVLVPVKLLINGTKIAQVEQSTVTYYHVELSRHAVILAEGLPAESYLDAGDRANFDDDPATIRLFPDFSARLAPDAAWLWETRGAAKLVLAGEELEAARMRVAQDRNAWWAASGNAAWPF